MTYFDRAEPDHLYPLEEQIYDCCHSLLNWLILKMDKSDDDPADYPRPEDWYCDAEEAKGECYMWHYAAVA